MESCGKDQPLSSTCRHATCAITFGLFAASALSAADPKYLQEQMAAQKIRAEESSSRPARRSRNAWLISIPVFVLANILDAHSSWGKPEANGLLQGRQGRFDGRSVALKSAIAGAVIAGEYGLARSRPGGDGSGNAVYLGSACSNFVTSAILSVTAMRNYRVPAQDTSASR